MPLKRPKKSYATRNSGSNETNAKLSKLKECGLCKDSGNTKRKCKVDWIECETCKTLFHVICLNSLSQQVFDLITKLWDIKAKDEVSCKGLFLKWLCDSCVDAQDENDSPLVEIKNKLVKTPDKQSKCVFNRSQHTTSYGPLLTKSSIATVNIEPCDYKAIGGKTDPAVGLYSSVDYGETSPVGDIPGDRLTIKEENDGDGFDTEFYRETSEWGGSGLNECDTTNANSQVGPQDSKSWQTKTGKTPVILLENGSHIDLTRIEQCAGTLNKLPAKSNKNRRRVRTKNGQKLYFYECNHCHKYVRNLVSHLRTHTGEKPYGCDNCPKTYSTKYHLGVHMRTHTGEKPYSCKFCLKKFSERGSLNSHIKTHTEPQKVSCEYCRQRFRLKSNLRRHIKTHNADRPYSCKRFNCQHTFSSKPDLINHGRTHKPDRRKQFLCDICAKIFSSKHKLINHVRIHTGEKPYVCKSCPKKFPTKTQLDCHKRIHSGDKLFGCNQCKYVTRWQHDLKIHHMKHSGEKPYSCNDCQKTFYKQFNLEKHYRTHTGEKPYPCQICSKGLASKHALLNHMKAHAGTRPFSCKSCKFTCCYEKDLIQHTTIHTGEKPFPCNFCPMRCNRKSNLRLHLKTHSKNLGPKSPNELIDNQSLRNS